jgi:hypothetical protein
MNDDTGGRAAGGSLHLVRLLLSTRASSTAATPVGAAPVAMNVSRFRATTPLEAHKAHKAHKAQAYKHELPARGERVT